jgi:aminoglycoside 6'-N-acetyltransferase I
MLEGYSSRNGEYEKRIIGYVFANRFIWYNGRLVFINDLVISGDYQGRGAGKEILNHIVNFCKEREIKGIFLSAHLESSAIGFYEKLGFKRTKWMWFEKKL